MKATTRISGAARNTERFDYGANMGCLSRAERKKLLEPYLKNPKVNWAHIAIATMLEAGFVHRVLTFNFDSVLARACGLLGLYPATYDFAAAHSAETSYIASPAIVHLHGQGYGMVMLNSDDETRLHAGNLRPLLRRVLNEAPLLVIGYSGTADAVFPVIREVFTGEQRLCWASYSDPVDHAIAELVKIGAEADALWCAAGEKYARAIEIKLDKLEALNNWGNALDEQACRKDDAAAADVLWLDAGEKYARALKINPNTFEAYNNWGSAMGARARRKETGEARIIWQAATEKFARAIEIKPDMNEAFSNWGNALSDQANALALSDGQLNKVTDCPR